MSTQSSKADMEHFRRLLDRDIKIIRVVHADFFGRQRAKQFPVSYVDQLIEGIAYSKMSISEDLMGVPVDENAFPQVAGHPDIFAKIEPGSAVIPPWEPDAVWVLAALYERNGELSNLCARGALLTANKRLADELNLKVIAAAEPEFYLFEKQVEGSKPLPYGTDGVSYTVDRITDPLGSIGRMHRNLIDFGIGVTALNREFSPGQFEINLHHDEVLHAADQVFLLKSGIKELAILEGLNANFMAKPIKGEEGSGLHVHMSFWDSQNRNVFASDTDEVNEVLLNALAGIQLHAPAILAFAAPTVNSYKRLQGNGLSPRSSNWAVDNRYSFLRIPPEKGKATRFELRVGDASASSHLLMASMIHAARDGINRGLKPTAEGVPLPKSLAASIEALEADDIMREALSSELVEIYAALKRAEISAYESSVTDWEWNLYHSHA